MIEFWVLKKIRTMNFIKRDWTIESSFYTKKAYFKGVKSFKNSYIFFNFLIFQESNPSKSLLRIAILLETAYKVVHVPLWYSTILTLADLSFECKVVRIPPPAQIYV